MRNLLLKVGMLAPITAMTIGQRLLGEFEHEVGSTRKILERVPEDRLGWKPHEKSMTLGRLAGHVAELVEWGLNTLTLPGYDIHKEADGRYRALTMTGRAEVLEKLDQSASETKRVLNEVSDEAMGQPWTLSMEGRTLMTMPRAGAYRALSMSHLIHHRGQLTVYLRMLDVPFPGCYGPSADDGSTF